MINNVTNYTNNTWTFLQGYKREGHISELCG